MRTAAPDQVATAQDQTDRDRLQRPELRPQHHPADDRHRESVHRPDRRQQARDRQKHLEAARQPRVLTRTRDQLLPHHRVRPLTGSVLLGVAHVVGQLSTTSLPWSPARARRCSRSRAGPARRSPYPTQPRSSTSSATRAHPRATSKRSRSPPPCTNPQPPGPARGRSLADPGRARRDRQVRAANSASIRVPSRPGETLWISLTPFVCSVQRVRNIPTLRLSYGNLLLKELESRPHSFDSRTTQRSRCRITLQR